MTPAGGGPARRFARCAARAGMSRAGPGVGGVAAARAACWSPPRPGCYSCWGIGLFGVSLGAQYRFVFHAKHQAAASWVEARALDAGMAIFLLLALGLARAGQPARAERGLIMACAGASGVMNFAAASDASPKSVVAYVMPPMFLAVVAGQASVARRYAVGQDERSPWLAAAPLVLYAVRLALASLSTAAGLSVGPGIW
jgi:hypothetical protein